MGILMGAPDLGIAISVPLADDAMHALAAQWERSEQIEHIDGFREKLASKVAEVISQSLDWDLQPPTRPQVSFAAAIARTLGLPVPAAALRFRGEMYLYLSRHAEEYKARMNPRPAKKAALDGDKTRSGSS